MQVLREALLQSLPAQIVQFTVIRNKILCLTQNQLILLCIDGICKKTQIPYNGSCVYKMQMSKDYIALLQRTGKLQIRRVDNLSSVILMDKNIKIINNHYPKMKWWEDDLHLVYQKYVVTLNISNCNNGDQKQKSTVEIDKQKHLLHIQFTDLFNEAKSMFYVFKNQIKLTINDIAIASIKLPINQQIKQILRLCHPFQQGEYNKQYLAVLTEMTKQSKSVTRSKFIVLKVYNILTLELIFEKQLYEHSQHDTIIEVQMLTDELSQYLLIKQYKRATAAKSSPFTKRQVQAQTLLKVNSEYIYSSTKPYDQHYEPFFMFDIEIGLKKDMKLFLSHVEQIGGKLCQSIDTCYFEENEVHIASIVLERSYRNDIYYKWRNVQIVIKHDQNVQHDEKQQSNQFVIWRELVEAKVSPKKFLQKLIITSELAKYNHSHQKVQKHNNVTQSNSIGLEHESILQSLLSKLYKINNFNLVNQKIDAYQTMKKILAIEYFPMLLDVMSIERDENKTQREILQKSNEDGAKTMSGCSSRGPQSPRSDKSELAENPNKDKNIILKDLSIINNTINNPQFFTAKNAQQNQPCQACQQIEDHENLELTLDIINESARNSDLALLKIQESIHRMQTLTKYRLQKIEMKTRREKKQSAKIVSIIETQFHESLNNLQSTLLSSAKRFTQKLALLPQQSISAINNHTEEFTQTIQQKRLLYDNSSKIHKDNHEQILDYLYDIEFPQIGFESEPKEQSMFDYFNLSDLSKSMISQSYGLNRTVTEMASQRQNRDEEFRMFSEFVLKNFI